MEVSILTHKKTGIQTEFFNTTSLLTTQKLNISTLHTDGVIHNNNLGDIFSNLVVSSDISNNAILTRHINDQSVTTSKIADQNITSSKFNKSLVLPKNTQLEETPNVISNNDTISTTNFVQTIINNKLNYAVNWDSNNLSNMPFKHINNYSQLTNNNYYLNNIRNIFEINATCILPSVLVEATEIIIINKSNTILNITTNDNILFYNAFYAPDGSNVLLLENNRQLNLMSIITATEKSWQAIIS